MGKNFSLSCFVFGTAMLMLFSSCGSTKSCGFAKEENYKVVVSAESISPEVALKEGEKPEIVYLQDKKYPTTKKVSRYYTDAEDSLQSESIVIPNENNKNIEDVVFTYIQEKHYKIVGISSFTNKVSAPTNMISHKWKIKNDLVDLCRKHNATTIIWGYFKRILGTTTSLTYSVTTYNQVLKAYTTTTYGGDTREQKDYVYTAYLLAPYSETEKATWRLGIKTRDLTADDRKELKRNTGALVEFVFKDYPAYFANISAGDIITKINGTEILTLEDCQKTEQTLERGSKANIAFLRNGIEKTITVEIK